MNDPTDDLIPLAKVAKLLPPELGKVHASTAARWALRGVGNPRVRIETVKIGGRRFVTRAAVENFIAVLSMSGSAAVAVALSPKRQKQIKDADAVLDAAGV